MYADPAKIRSHIVKIRLSQEEHNLIQALVDYTGEQRAALLRELILEQAQLVLFGDQSSPMGYAVEGNLKALRSA
ncbi:MAG: hypothetical protein N0E44_17995 [Candidatus Thiodiazotropha lotti]|nr:hypothetical protein [Candidatus Thiodiazotropha lotti]MCW4221776.1 hypothetical protein [Candidatus Thiodiazotropha lotti]